MPNFTLLKILTGVTFYLELFGPFLLFIPWKNEKFRLIFVYCFFAFHLFIGVTMYVGLFFLINWISLIGLIPSKQIDRLESLNWVKKIKGFFFKLFNFFSHVSSFKSDVTNLLRFKLNEAWQYQLKLLYQGILFFVICLNVLWCIQLLENSPLKVSKDRKSVV